ncbi:MAG: hypothetical protein AABW83_04620 [Nanoarchaeota archaeon]
MKEKTSLVSQLKYFDNCNEELRFLIEICNNDIKKFLGEDSELEINEDNIPHINVTQAQIDLINNILRESENNILRQAVKKRKSIEDSLCDLSKDNEGLLAYLPKLTDERYNIKVNEMVELIGEENILIPALDKNSLSLLMKPVSLFPFISCGICYLTAFFVEEYIKQKFNIQQIYPYFSLSFGIFGFYRGVEISYKAIKTNKDLPWKKAKYLDEKINELF